MQARPKPAQRRKAATQKRQWPDMETLIIAPPGKTFERDLGRNATPMGQAREFIWAENLNSPWFGASPCCGKPTPTRASGSHCRDPVLVSALGPV